MGQGKVAEKGQKKRFQERGHRKMPQAKFSGKKDIGKGHRK